MIGPQARRHPAPGGGLAVLVAVTVLAALAGPNAKALRGLVADGRAVIASPATPTAPAIRRPPPGAALAVAFAMRQRGKPYRWGAEGPGAFDCSGLTWAAWRAAGGGHSPDRGCPARRPPQRQGSAAAWRSAHLCQPGPVAAACGDCGRPGSDGRGLRPRHPGPLHQHPPQLAGRRPTGRRPMTAAFLDFLGWDGLTAAEQAAALAGACLGLAVWLLARAIFGGRRRR
jgi:NlpC/P60 family